MILVRTKKSIDGEIIDSIEEISISSLYPYYVDINDVIWMMTDSPTLRYYLVNPDLIHDFENIIKRKVVSREIFKIYKIIINDCISYIRNSKLEKLKI